MAQVSNWLFYKIRLSRFKTNLLFKRKEGGKNTATCIIQRDAFLELFQDQFPAELCCLGRWGWEEWDITEESLGIPKEGRKQHNCVESKKHTGCSRSPPLPRWGHLAQPFPTGRSSTSGAWQQRWALCRRAPQSSKPTMCRQICLDRTHAWGENCSRLRLT